MPVIDDTMHCLSILDAILFYSVVIPVVSPCSVMDLLEYATRVNEFLAFLRDV